MKKVSNIILIVIAVIFLLTFLKNLIPSKKDDGKSKKQTISKTYDPFPPVEPIFRITKKGGEFLSEEDWVRIIPGYDIITETIPRGQDVTIVVRDIDGEKFADFCLNGGTGMTKPNKPIPAGRTFFLDVASKGNETIKVAFRFLPPLN